MTKNVDEYAAEVGDMPTLVLPGFLAANPEVAAELRRGRSRGYKYTTLAGWLGTAHGVHVSAETVGKWLRSNS